MGYGYLKGFSAFDIKKMTEQSDIHKYTIFNFQ